MPFLSDRQRDYLKREHPEVYARFVRDEGRTGAHPEYPSAGRIAWDLWGGDAGRAYAKRQLAIWDRVQGATREQP